MIKVSILYPYRENGRFDSECCGEQHMPLAACLFGDALQDGSVDIGINAGPLPYVAAGHFLSDTPDAFQPPARTLLNDIPNYTGGGNGSILVSGIKVSA